MMDMAVTGIKQHLIDPEICIRCNTCETMCPVGASTHDSCNDVVDADKCDCCNACSLPCPAGSIDNYRQILRVKAFSLVEQMGWEELPQERSHDQLADLAGDDAALEDAAPALAAAALVESSTESAFNTAQQYGLAWDSVGAASKREGRLHLQTC